MGAYKHNYAAFGRLVLNSPEMEALMLAKAEKIKTTAEAIAPDATPFGEGFKFSFSAMAGKRGGILHDRAYGRVTNDDPAARFIELGTSKTPAHRSLGRALGMAGD